MRTSTLIFQFADYTISYVRHKIHSMILSNKNFYNVLFSCYKHTQKWRTNEQQCDRATQRTGKVN